MPNINKTFIIAEAGVNHNGSLTIAKQLVEIAKNSGADAVKFQSFNADNLVCGHAPKAEYQQKNNQQESQYEMLKSLELTPSNQLELFHFCNTQEILFLSSPFDLDSADFLVTKLNLNLIKIPSGEITNLPLLLKLARSQVQVILSTGMCTLGEIENALSVLAYGYLNSSETFPTLNECLKSFVTLDAQTILKEKVALLHCVTEYPAPYDEINLNVINTLKQAFNLRVGYSDHTLGIAIPIAAVACGATIIEKHFTLDKSSKGPDHQASLEPHELKQMIAGIREVEKALGISQKYPRTSEWKNRDIARKSIVAKKTIAIGDKFNLENIDCKRPGTGISPLNFSLQLKEHAKKNYQPDEII